jgi:hypothetical protein
MKFSRTINQRQLSVRLVKPTILYSPYLARAYSCRKSQNFEKNKKLQCHRRDLHTFTITASAKRKEKM